MAARHPFTGPPWILAGALLSVACGDEAPADPDGGRLEDAGGRDAAADAGEGLVAPPLPDLTPCPEGWREVEEDGITTCDPWPEGGVADCAADAAHFPGEPGCSRIGTTCPEGDLPEGLPDDGTVLYVRAGATGGDGSRGRPFGTIPEAMGAAEAGTTIAVGKGAYDGVVRMRGGVTLHGACVAETLLTSTEPSPADGIVQAFRSGTVVLRNLSVGESARPAIVAGREAELVIEDVLVVGSRSFGVLNRGGHVRVRSSVVRDTRSADDGSVGWALAGMLGRFDVSRAVLERSREAAVSVNRSTVVLEDLAIRDTLPRMAGDTFGRAIQGGIATRLEMRRCVLSDNRESGVLVFGEGGEIDLDHVIVRRVSPQASDGTLGRGILVQAGVTGSIRRTLVEDTHDAALFAAGDGVSLSVRDLVVRRTESRASDGTRGRGLNAQENAEVAVERSAFVHNRECGVFSSNGSRVELRSTHVLHTRTRACAEDTCADEALAVGLGAFRDGSIDAARFVVSGSELCGVQLAADGVIDLVDGEVAHSEIGVCFQVPGYDMTRLTERVLFRDNGTNLQATMLPLPEVAMR